jgi:hypothetical protein
VNYKSLMDLIEARISIEEDFPLRAQIDAIGELIDRRERRCARKIKAREMTKERAEEIQMPLRAIMRTLGQVRTALEFIEREHSETALLPEAVKKEREVGAQNERERILNRLQLEGAI